MQASKQKSQSCPPSAEGAAQQATTHDLSSAQGFAAGLAQVQQTLNEIPQIPYLRALNRHQSEEDVALLIRRTARMGPDRREFYGLDQTFLTSVSKLEVAGNWVAMLGALAGLIWIIVPPMEGSQLSPLVQVAILLLVSVPAGVLAALHLTTNFYAYRVVRDRVFRKKKYQQELRRIVAENREKIQQEAQALEVLDQKMDEARTLLEPLSVQYAHRNPGFTLTLDTVGGRIAEKSDPTLSPSELLVARATGQILNESA